MNCELCIAAAKVRFLLKKVVCLLNKFSDMNDIALLCNAKLIKFISL